MEETSVEVLVITQYTATDTIIERWVETGKPFMVYNICNGERLLMGLRGTRHSLLKALYQYKYKLYKERNLLFTCTFDKIVI